MIPIEELNFVNFFSVVDVAKDIMEELQMTSKNTVKIPVVRRVIRFKELYPGNIMNPELIDNYGKHRLKGLEYLKEGNYIISFELLRPFNHRWDAEVEVSVNKATFQEFCKRLDEVFKKRVVEPQKREREKAVTDIKNDTDNSTLKGGKQEPLKISIVSGFEGVEKGLQDIAKTNKEKSKNKFPHSLPSGTEWKNFILQFLNKEEMMIKANRFEHHAKFDEMGFTDNRYTKARPNEGWTFLWVIAKYFGELKIRDKDAKDSYKKQKELVSKALKSYFTMESDPFYPYHDTKSYKTRFTILAPPGEDKVEYQRPLSGKELLDKMTIDEEIKDFYEKQAEQVQDRNDVSLKRPNREK